MSIRNIITDIEGTTTDIHFVHHVLFPYSRDKMYEFLLTHQSEPAIIQELDTIRTLIGDPKANLNKITQQLLTWIKEDVKVAPLKNIQGMIWEIGFTTHAFQGHVYEDAFLKLTQWHQAGIKLHIYSSGSVQAQQLLFAFSEFGDITYLFSRYFDTAIGGKKEASSYRTLLETIQATPSETLFLSDIPAELDAAKANGIQTGWLIRKDAPPSHSEHPIYTTFNDILLT